MYAIRISCADCTNVDPQGCWAGGYAWVKEDSSGIAITDDFPDALIEPDVVRGLAPLECTKSQLNIAYPWKADLTDVDNTPH